MEQYDSLFPEAQRRINTEATTIRAFTGLCGTRGWLYMNWAWRIRGALDRLCGGVGLRRGRRDADSVRVREALDFWRVEAVELGHQGLTKAKTFRHSLPSHALARDHFEPPIRFRPPLA